MAFFRKCCVFFKSPNLPKKLFQITILNLKFKFPTNKSKQQIQAQDSNLEYFSIGDLKNESHTPSIPEIIWVKNLKAIVVCGSLMKSLKNHFLKIFKKLGVPFRCYLLNSTAIPAHFHSNWAESAVLFSR